MCSQFTHCFKTHLVEHNTDILAGIEERHTGRSLSIAELFDTHLLPPSGRVFNYPTFHCHIHH